MRTLMIAMLAAVSIAAPVHAASPADPLAHDPSMMRDGAHFYEVDTGGPGVPGSLFLRRSTDLRRWEELGPVAPTLPTWVPSTLGLEPDRLWAPDLSYFRGRYHVYYAASKFATNNSVIGLLTSPSLDPASPGHGWVDEGPVLRSTPGVDDFNAIDPDVVFGADGRLWLAFGSYGTGIKLRLLDPATGKPSPQDPTTYPLASRPPPGAIEGASIVHRAGWYYLFASFDGCCRGVDSSYRVVVGRSTGITGPHLARDGVPMTQGGGTELLRGYGRYAGPGHGEGVQDGRAEWFADHYYERADAGRPKLSVRPIVWSEGWPSFREPVSSEPEAPALRVMGRPGSEPWPEGA